METVKIKYFDDELERITINPKGDWIDLRSAIDCDLKKDEFKLIPLGIAMELPQGYEAHIVPRSSTYKNFGVIQTNHMGVVDNSYCGDNDQWYYPAICLKPSEEERGVWIHKGDKICQFRIQENQPEIRFEEVDHLTGKDRGGFGSTGNR